MKVYILLFSFLSIQFSIKGQNADSILMNSLNIYENCLDAKVNGVQKSYFIRSNGDTTKNTTIIKFDFIRNKKLRFAYDHESSFFGKNYSGVIYTDFSGPKASNWYRTYKVINLEDIELDLAVAKAIPSSSSLSSIIIRLFEINDSLKSYLSEICFDGQVIENLHYYQLKFDCTTSTARREQVKKWQQASSQNRIAPPTRGSISNLRTIWIDKTTFLISKIETETKFENFRVIKFFEMDWKINSNLNPENVTMDFPKE